MCAASAGPGGDPGGGLFWSGWSPGFAFWELLNQQHTYATGARTTHSSALTPGLDLVGQSARRGGACSCSVRGQTDQMLLLSWR